MSVWWSKVKWSESHSVMSNSLRSHGQYSPWNSLGKNTGVGSLSLLQGIFPNQGLNQGLLHCRGILYQLSHREVYVMKPPLKKKKKIQSWESFWVDEYIQVLGGWHTPTIGRQMLVYSDLFIWLFIYITNYIFYNKPVNISKFPLSSVSHSNK